MTLLARIIITITIVISGSETRAAGGGGAGVLAAELPCKPRAAAVVSVWRGGKGAEENLERPMRTFRIPPFGVAPKPESVLSPFLPIKNARPERERKLHPTPSRDTGMSAALPGSSPQPGPKHF